MTVKQSIIHHVAVLIAGGGPAGLILALQLANHGVDCLMAERNADTTSYPKMDITNCRSMELFRRLGIAEGFRQQGMSFGVAMFLVLVRLTCIAAQVCHKTSLSTCSSALALLPAESW